MEDGFEPAEGGVKIVFDVREPEVGAVAAQVAAAGFAVHRYYDPDDEHGPGGSPPGYVRLGAERPMWHFTDAEVQAIVADFDQLQAREGFACARVGTDSWTAGGDGSSGDREPRVPPPRRDAGSAAVELV